MHDPVSVLILPLLEVSLDHFGVVGLQAVRLDLEAFVHFLNVLNVILDCLCTLSLDCQVRQAAAHSRDAGYWVEVVIICWLSSGW